jgi:hypothetical protein
VWRETQYLLFLLQLLLLLLRLLLLLLRLRCLLMPGRHDLLHRQEYFRYCHCRLPDEVGLLPADEVDEVDEGDEVG